MPAEEGLVFPEMINVDGGDFRMGDDKGYPDERGEHIETIQRFSIGKYMVTQELWLSIETVNPSIFRGALRPVDSVSWFEAVKFCNKLSETHQLVPVYYENENGEWVRNFDADGYRLPTEAEWEYAARGGQKNRGYKFSGSNYIDDVCWYEDNSEEMSHFVGTMQSNQLGICDMSGNLWEWVFDWSQQYQNEDETIVNDPQPIHRVNRGGSWWDEEICCQVSHRGSDPPEAKFKFIGFRLARTI
jgi:sulfatase modifying factor 1